MISLKVLERIITLPELSKLMTHDYWAQAMGLEIRLADTATTNPMRALSECRNGARDLDVSMAYMMSNRFNR
jgi:hypothetical protein